MPLVVVLVCLGCASAAERCRCATWRHQSYDSVLCCGCSSFAAHSSLFKCCSHGMVQQLCTGSKQPQVACAAACYGVREALHFASGKCGFERVQVLYFGVRVVC